MKLSSFLDDIAQYDKWERLDDRNPNDWLKSVSAFANGTGGALFFGVSDDETLVGLDDAKDVSEKISETIEASMKPVPQTVLNIHKADGKQFIVLHVPSGHKTPYYTDCRCTAWVRTGNENVPAGAADLKRLVMRGSYGTYDSLPSSYPADSLSFTLLRSFYRKQTFSELTASDFITFGLADENNMLTNAGVLLADDSPIRQSRVFCTRWYGLTKASEVMDALDDREYEGSLISQFLNSFDFIRNNTKKRWKKTGFGRIEMPEYPEQAVREVLVNALTHRDYTVAGSEVHISIFDDRIEVYSPGGMPGRRPGVTAWQTIDTEEISTRRRNPVLADIFTRLDLVRHSISGFRTIREAYKHAVNYRPEVEPKFRSDHSSFLVTLYNLNYNIPVESAPIITPKDTFCDDEKVLIDASESTPDARSINTPKDHVNDTVSNTEDGSNSGGNDLISSSGDMSCGDKKVLIDASESTADARPINTPKNTFCDDEKVLIGTPAWAENTKKLLATFFAVADIIHSLKAAQSTRDSIKKLFVHMNFTGGFGRKELMETLNISSTSAGNLINKMKEAKLIEALSGHGKGKYRFIVPQATF